MDLKKFNLIFRLSTPSRPKRQCGVLDLSVLFVLLDNSWYDSTVLPQVKCYVPMVHIILAGSKGGEITYFTVFFIEAGRTFRERESG